MEPSFKIKHTASWITRDSTKKYISAVQWQLPISVFFKKKKQSAADEPTQSTSWATYSQHFVHDTLHCPSLLIFCITMKSWWCYTRIVRERERLISSQCVMHPSPSSCNSLYGKCTHHHCDFEYNELLHWHLNVKKCCTCCDVNQTNF